MNRRSLRAFTLIELLVVIAIVGMLAAMVAPELGRVQDRAQSVTCVNNLRQIGVGVLSYVGENDNTYPMIEPNEDDPIYGKETDDKGEFEIKPMLPSLEPYGVTEGVLKCPSDIRHKGTQIYFDTRGTSYQWRITADGENLNNLQIYGGRRGYGVRVAKPSRVTICTDFEAIHNGRRTMNRLYADGHVSKPF